MIPGPSFAQLEHVPVIHVVDPTENLEDFYELTTQPSLFQREKVQLVQAFFVPLVSNRWNEFGSPGLYSFQSDDVLSEMTPDLDCVLQVQPHKGIVQSEHNLLTAKTKLSPGVALHSLGLSSQLQYTVSRTWNRY